jgi:hypothetical protein
MNQPTYNKDYDDAIALEEAEEVALEDDERPTWDADMQADLDYDAMIEDSL